MPEDELKVTCTILALSIDLALEPDIVPRPIRQRGQRSLLRIPTRFFTFTYRVPQTLAECIRMLQQMNGIVLPQLDTDWYQIDRQDVDIRRNHILEDSLREGKKRNFDPKKVVKVSVTIL